MAAKTITNDTPPEVIEQDIAHARQELSGTVEAIREILSAEHFRETARENIRTRFRDAAGRAKGAASRFGQTARERGSVVMGTVQDTFRNSPVTAAVKDTVRNNPVPIAMMSMGLAWLLYNKRSSEEGGFGAETRASVRQKAGEFAGKAQETAGELAGRLREKSVEFAGTARESAGQIRRSAGEQANEAKTRVQLTIHNNPIGALLAAFASSAIIGLIIPESRRERDVMGQASKSLMGKAKETAQRTFERAQHAAESAAHAAGEEFRKEAA